MRPYLILILICSAILTGCTSEADKAIIEREKMRKIDAQLDAEIWRLNQEMEAGARRQGL